MSQRDWWEQGASESPWRGHDDLREGPGGQIKKLKKRLPPPATRPLPRACPLTHGFCTPSPPQAALHSVAGSSSTFSGHTRPPHGCPQPWVPQPGKANRTVRSMGRPLPTRGGNGGQDRCPLAQLLPCCAPGPGEGGAVGKGPGARPRPLPAGPPEILLFLNPHLQPHQGVMRKGGAKGRGRGQSRRHVSRCKTATGPWASAHPRGGTQGRRRAGSIHGQ